MEDQQGDQWKIDQQTFKELANYGAQLGVAALFWKNVTLRASAVCCNQEVRSERRTVMRWQRLRGFVLVSFLSMSVLCSYVEDPPLTAQELKVSPYMPTPQEVVVAMLHAANVGPDDVLYDLGCGDGRIVVTAAKQFGARATGVDINPQLLREAQAHARQAGVTDRVQFLQQDLFETELRDATVVTLYLLSKVNLRLRPQLLHDLKPGSRVVSHAFSMGKWLPDQVVRVKGRNIYLWVVPARVEGTWVWHQAGTTESQPYRLRLTQHFQRLSGTLQTGGEETPLTDVKLRGGFVHFTVMPPVQGQPVRMTFHGRVDGNQMAGHVKIDNAAAEDVQPWRAERIVGKELGNIPGDHGRAGNLPEAGPILDSFNREAEEITKKVATGEVSPEEAKELTAEFDRRREEFFARFKAEAEKRKLQ